MYSSDLLGEHEHPGPGKPEVEHFGDLLRGVPLSSWCATFVESERKPCSISFQVVQLGTCYAGGFTPVLDVAVYAGDETGFTEGAVAGVPSGRRRGWLLRGGRGVEE